jgi:hypothetical protein
VAAAGSLRHRRPQNPNHHAMAIAARFSFNIKTATIVLAAIVSHIQILVPFPLQQTLFRVINLKIFNYKSSTIILSLSLLFFPSVE